MCKAILKSILGLAAVLAEPFALAQDLAPDELLKTVTLEVVALIRQDKDIRAGNTAKVVALVEMKILPHFDFDHMTRLAAGQNWRLATPEQQKALTSEFRMLLVHTYSTALASYSEQVIEFRPLRTVPGDTMVTVRSLVKQSGAASLTLDYDLERHLAGWKVYDIRFEGVSLISTYRETFASKVRESGMDSLIRLLAEKNRRGA
jgi:phospholipid transport system substrate-binding protein